MFTGQKSSRLQAPTSYRLPLGHSWSQPGAIPHLLKFQTCQGWVTKYSQRYCLWHTLPHWKQVRWWSLQSEPTGLSELLDWGGRKTAPHALRLTGVMGRGPTTPLSLLLQALLLPSVLFSKSHPGFFSLFQPWIIRQYREFNGIFEVVICLSYTYFSGQSFLHCLDSSAPNPAGLPCDQSILAWTHQ